MSLRATNWALYEAPVNDATALLVLLALADQADESGRNAWPGINLMAKAARCSTRTVSRKLKQLEEGGVIRRGDQRLTGHHAINRRPVVWDLGIEDPPADAWGDKLSPQKSADLGVTTGASGVTELCPGRGDTGDMSQRYGVTNEAVWGDTPGSSGVTPMSTDPPFNPKDNPLNTHASVSEIPGNADRLRELHFNRWYSTYPRRVGKGAAERAFKAALKHIGPEALQTATEDYAREVATADPKFIPYPATWLNQRRWEDEKPQAVPASSPWNPDFHHRESEDAYR